MNFSFAGYVNYSAIDFMKDALIILLVKSMFYRLKLNPWWKLLVSTKSFWCMTKGVLIGD